MGVIVHVLSMLATGAVVLLVFFGVLAQISPREVAAVVAVVAAAGALAALRALRVGYEVRTGGAPELRSARTRQRERRGF